ncbi:MAG: SPFH domain-containing protein [Chthoniobacteraceae bacterium]
MKLLTKFAMLGVLCALIWGAETYWVNVMQSDISRELAIRQLNGGNGAFDRLRAFESTKDIIHTACTVAMIVGACVVFSTPPSRSRHLTMWPMLILMMSLTGCVRQFDKPEYALIDTSETGFLIPLEGNSGEQAKFESEEYLKANKAPSKRVQITHRWSQEGRFPTDGQWIPNVRLIKVDRSPVTREWTADSTTGTSNKNQAIWIESADSVGFSMGFTCTAYIPEESAAKFLYWYPSGSLAQVMDTEIRGRIQQAASEVAAKYPLDSLREKKQEICDAVRSNVTDFFLARGVVVTTIGMFGGMTYENQEIQKSIDATVIAQQLKVVNQAKFEAQQKDNERVELEANATAEKARRIASGEADAKKTIALAEAQAIREINKALSEGQQNPLLYQFKTLDVEKARVEKWNGAYPNYYISSGGGNGAAAMLLQVPPPSVK